MLSGSPGRGASGRTRLSTIRPQVEYAAAVARNFLHVLLIIARGNASAAVAKDVLNSSEPRSGFEALERAGQPFRDLIR